MNFGQWLHHLGVILGIFGNQKGTETTLSTLSSFTGSSPIITDTTEFIQYRSSDGTHAISPDLLSSLITRYDSNSTPNKLNTATDYAVSGITKESVTDSRLPMVSNATEHAPSTSHVTVKTTTSNVTDGTTYKGNTTIAVTTPTVNQTTTIANETTPTVPETTTIANETTPTLPETTTIANETTPTVPETTTIANETTPTVHETTTNANETTPTDHQTTHTGTETTHTGTETTGTGTGPTGPPPTDKPGLTRGAVAGIVIGVLLLVAVIIAGIVFVVKNRKNPEIRRLNV